MNRKRKSNKEIEPDEIFMDSQNIPQYDTQQFEGRLEKPISSLALTVLFAFFVLVLLSFATRTWVLQVAKGDYYNQKSENNRLRHTPVFAARGVIYDRNGVELAWNAPSDDPDIALRKYSGESGLAHTVGYVQYPSKDSAGFYYKEDFEGLDGVEKHFNQDLQGTNGLKLVEVDARGQIQSQNIVQPPKEGGGIYLSIDSRIQSKLYESIKDVAVKVGFAGGAGVIMDIKTGEIIAMTNYPEYDSEIMSSRADVAKIKSYLANKNKPFLNRAVDGLYTPGSIVKPYMALAALNEKIIDPLTKILSTGSISVQNQYFPDLQTVFKDWKAHGYVDMRQALSVSSDVYFYAVGGGYKDQKGLGIARIEKYMNMFGFGQKIENSFFKGAGGVVPNPDWKKAHFNGEAWNLGNTYHTTIGQYGFQVSPIQMVRAVGALVNEGLVRDPTIIKGQTGPVLRQLDIPKSYYNIVKEGMRMGATTGTAGSMNAPYVEVAAKSGTAELGTAKADINSWMTGYFPYKNPRYAFAVLLEKGTVHYQIGAGTAMRETMDWMNQNTPEYFK
jgi:penicillin-binding protein 2